MVEANVLIATDILAPAERQAIEQAVSSWDNFRRLTSDPRGVGDVASKLRLVRVTPRFRLMYRENATQVHVLDLINEGTITAFEIEPHLIPIRRSRPLSKSKS